MKSPNQILLILFLFLIAGCSQGTKEEKSASQFCDCAEPYVKKTMKLMEDLGNMKNVSEDKFKSMTAEGQQYSDSLNKCIDKYKTELADKKVIEALKQNCPETAQLLDRVNGK